ncbi:oxidoreductase domain protein [Paenibacillus curdlanolyticus YK9]|uniref:Oxidoreductase domain protein n=1 Tax=Paenibacillus curdlanolyticus YK9 TaxID=717606 RepID=E0IFF9_9BACL|nr:Gfo/Idh/MocA family oxidoreductase [Paenibacillus curdlanolyticus]EFM08935.1 oxidoreductase domain protein [Paenibacillus curdlanolyticus YK9]
MAKLKVGLIGLGGIADFHSKGILESPDAEIWAISDCNAELLERRSKEWDIPASRTYLDYEIMLQDPELDAVTIGTPNNNHFEIAKSAIENGKTFALEKPVALNASEAAILQQLIEQKPLPHFICFSYRYKSAVRYAKQLIDEGKLGTIHHVYSQYLQSWALRDDIPLVWRFRKELTGSGAIGDLGSHILDLTRFLIGDTQRVLADADTVIAERELLDGSGKGAVDVDDYCHVLSRIEGGISSAMMISRFAYGRGNYQQIEIYGTKGALIYNLEDEDTLQVKLADENDMEFRKVEAPDECKVGQMQAFFDLVNGMGDGYDATMTDGYVNQLAVDAIIQSFTEQKWISIKKEMKTS